MSERKVLTIVRSQWDRGEQDGSGRYLLNLKTGKMCCLGFDALACGLTPEAIAWCGSPARVAVSLGWGRLPDSYRTRMTYVGSNALAAVRAMKANDDIRISDAAREGKVRAALIELGWDDVVFVD